MVRTHESRENDAALVDPPTPDLRVSTRVQPKMKQRIDKAAAVEGESRSEFVRLAIAERVKRVERESNATRPTDPTAKQAHGQGDLRPCTGAASSPAATLATPIVVHVSMFPRRRRGRRRPVDPEFLRGLMTRLPELGVDVKRSGATSAPHRRHVSRKRAT
jgi:Ribbon-helix-helix protein, copG family